MRIVSLRSVVLDLGLSWHVDRSCLHPQPAGIVGIVWDDLWEVPQEEAALESQQLEGSFWLRRRKALRPDLGWRKIPLGWRPGGFPGRVGGVFSSVVGSAGRAEEGDLRSWKGRGLPHATGGPLPAFTHPQFTLQP